MFRDGFGLIVHVNTSVSVSVIVCVSVVVKLSVFVTSGKVSVLVVETVTVQGVHLVSQEVP